MRSAGTVGLRCAALLVLPALVLLAGCDEKKSDGGATEKSAAEVLEKTTERGPVKMTLRVGPKEPRLSDLIDFDIVVAAPLEVEVKPPAFGEAVGEFLIRDYAERPVKLKGNERVREFHYRLEPMYAGKHLIRTIGVQFTDKRPDSESKGAPAMIESEPLEVTVTSELGDQMPSLADLTPMSEPVTLPPQPLSAWVIAAIAAGVVALLIVVMLRKRRKAITAALPRFTPEQIAQRELAELIAKNLPGKGLFKEFYVELTGIVRRYIERTTGIHAPEQTTEEFLRDMRSRQIFPAERAEQLRQFLEAADMVKYAGMLPGQRQVEDAIARAQEFVGLRSALSPMHAAPRTLEAAAR